MNKFLIQLPFPLTLKKALSNRFLAKITFVFTQCSFYKKKQRNQLWEQPLKKPSNGLTLSTFISAQSNWFYMILDNAALCEEMIKKERLLAKHINSERIRQYKMQFVSAEKKRNTELKLGLPIFHSFCTFACLCLTHMQLFWCSYCYYMVRDLASYTQNAMVSTQRDKDKGRVLAPLLSYLKCFLFFVCICYLSLRYPSSLNNHSLHVFWSSYHSLCVFWSSYRLQSQCLVRIFTFTSRKQITGYFKVRSCQIEGDVNQCSLIQTPPSHCYKDYVCWGEHAAILRTIHKFLLNKSDSSAHNTHQPMQTLRNPTFTASVFLDLFISEDVVWMMV